MLYKYYTRLRFDMNIIFIIILTLCITSIFFTKNFNGIETDGFLYVEVARNIVQGKGLVTSLFYPYELDSIKSLTHPYFGASPLHPILISIMFFIFGVHEWASVLLSIIFFLLIAVFLYCLGKEAFGRATGIIASLLFITDTNMLRSSITGMVEITYAFLLIAAIYSLFKARSNFGFLVSGLIFGLCQLTRQNTFIFLLPFLLYIFFTNKKRRLVSICVFLIGYAVISLPELLRVYIFTGSLINPVYQHAFFYKTALGSPFGGSIDVLKMVRPLRNITPLQYILTYPRDFLRKILLNIESAYKELPFLINPYKMAFFIVSCLRLENLRQESPLKLLIYAIILSQITLLIFFITWMRYFFPLVPLILLLAADFMVYIFKNLLVVEKKIKILIAMFLIVLIIGPLFSQLLYGVPGMSQNSFFSKDIRAEFKDFILKNTEPESFIVSDLFGIVGWDAQRPSMWLPLEVAPIYEVDKKFPIAYIILTSEYAPPQWRDFLCEKAELEGFRLKAKYKKGNLKAVLYAKEHIEKK